MKQNSNVMKQISVVRLMVTAFVVTIFFALTGLTANAQVTQTAEGDTSVTVEWDNPTRTDYSIGYAKVVGGKTYDAYNSAKTMASGRKIVLAESQKSYTINGLQKNTQYVVVVIRGTGSDRFPSTQDVANYYVCTKLDKVTNLKQVKWIKRGSVQVSWDDVPGKFENKEYEVRFMNSKGKIIEKKITHANSYTHDVKDSLLYKIQVRAIRKPDGKVSKVPQSSTPWTATEYLFAQPTVKTADIKKGKMTISWEKVEGATNYTIYASTSKTKGYKKVGSVSGKKNKFTIKKIKGKKIKKNKTYYVFVSANKKVKGKIIQKKVFYTYEIKNGKITERQKNSPYSFL